MLVQFSGVLARLVWDPEKVGGVKVIPLSEFKTSFPRVCFLLHFLLKDDEAS
jgi:hypothetical protein